MNQSFTTIIYLFMVIRMLYIYVQLHKDDPEKFTSRYKMADFVYRNRVVVILSYFAGVNMCYWTSFYLTELHAPKGDLTATQVRIYLALSLINWSLEMCLGITFCILWYYFY